MTQAPARVYRRADGQHTLTPAPGDVVFTAYEAGADIPDAVAGELCGPGPEAGPGRGRTPKQAPPPANKMRGPAGNKGGR